MNVKKSFANLKLGSKFTVLLSIVFLLGITFSGSALATLINQNAQNQIRSEAEILMKTLNSVRNYTNTEVSQYLVNYSETKFLPESIPSYAVREVFEILRSDALWQDFFYKDAALNPTNRRDKADQFETELVEYLRQNLEVKELSGFRNSNGSAENLFYIARPFSITQESCLECHSTPDKAPPSMLAIYGSENGFGWELNKILGVQIIYVPASQVFQIAKKSTFLIIGVVVIVFAAAIFLTNYWLKRYIVRPLKRITRVAEAVSTGDMEAEFATSSQDEVGTLAEAFKRMKTSLVLAMKRLERYRNLG